MTHTINGADEWMPDGTDPVTVEPCEYCRQSGFEMLRIKPRWFWQKPKWIPTICSNCHGYKVADWRFQFGQDFNRRPPTTEEAKYTQVR
jgi:hypothetical protein